MSFRADLDRLDRQLARLRGRLEPAKQNPATTLAALVSAVAHAARVARARIAIGGGVAVRAHGHRRETTDVDAFLRERDRRGVFEALREQGFEVAAVMPPFHYIAQRRGDPPDVRIDLLFPRGEPELDAIRKARPMRAEGFLVRVVPIEHLIAMKVIATATRGEAQDRADVQRLYGLGKFAPAKVRAFMAKLPEDYTTEFDEIMAAICRAAATARPRT